MKSVRICIFIISLLFSATGFSQESLPQPLPRRGEAQDSLRVEQYGVRVGVDLSKPIRSLIDENYRGFEILGDYRLYEDYYVAVEIGNERFLYDEPNLTAETSGSYFKIGANYNAYDNWLGMQNNIFVGLRYGGASFSETLERYSIYTGSDYFDPDVKTPNQEYKGLTASWLEFQAGIKVEVLHNVYLGLYAQLKRRLNQQAPTGFDNLYIPGFGKTYERSKFGAGWGYSISYFIPIYSK